MSNINLLVEQSLNEGLLSNTKAVVRTLSDIGREEKIKHQLSKRLKEKHRKLISDPNHDRNLSKRLRKMYIRAKGDQLKFKLNNLGIAQTPNHPDQQKAANLISSESDRIPVPILRSKK